MLMRLFCGSAFSFLIISSAFGAEESFDEAACKRASGYSKSLMRKVAEGIGVPEASLKYEGSFWGGGQVGACAGLFASPRGVYECDLAAWTSDGGKSFFIGPSSAGWIAGMHNFCKKVR
jgi:hypothetical protein